MQSHFLRPFSFLFDFRCQPGAFSTEIEFSESKPIDLLLEPFNLLAKRLIRGQKTRSIRLSGG
jgi:hypothetical protein